MIIEAFEAIFGFTPQAATPLEFSQALAKTTPVAVGIGFMINEAVTHPLAVRTAQAIRGLLWWG